MDGLILVVLMAVASTDGSVWVPTMDTVEEVAVLVAMVSKPSNLRSLYD